MKISIIGIGRMGGALAIALSRKGFQVENLIARKPEKVEKIVEYITPKPNILSLNEVFAIDSDVIFITTQDAEIERVAASLAEKLKGKPFVFHTSGALSSRVLDNLKEIGCKTGSFHPLVSVSDSVSGADSFEKVFFCVEGESAAVSAAKEIVEKLGGKSFFIDTKFKALYHASAVLACGHLVALMDVAIEMLQKCRLEESRAREILLPLIKSTIENLERQTTAQALTGTFARADGEALERQIKTLRENASPEALNVYLQLGLRSIHLAEARGENLAKLTEMRKTIVLAKKNFKC